jgi:hypothetical protein
MHIKIAIITTILYVGLAGHAAAQCASSDGQYQLAAVGGFQKPALYYSSDYGATWTASNTQPAVPGYLSLYVTASGAVMFAAQVNQAFVSINYGRDWLALNSSLFQTASANGQYQTATQHETASLLSPASFLVSSDEGTTWTQVFNSSMGNFPTSTVSRSGRYMLVTANGNGPVLLSSNFGVNWTKVDLPSDNYQRVAISSSGQYQSAVTLSGHVYTSSNFGASFSTESIGQQLVYNAMSCSGRWQVVVAKNDGNLLLSSDYGATWNVPSGLSLITNYWWVDMSCSGQHITAAEYIKAGDDDISPSPGRIVLSNDFGNSWQYAMTGNDWVLVAVNKVNGTTCH